MIIKSLRTTSPGISNAGVAATLAALALLTGCAALTSVLPAEADIPEHYRALPRSTGSGIQPPKVIRRVEPMANPEWVRSGRRRAATIEAVINTAGRVEAVWYVSGDRPWAEAVAAAVRDWTFEPARRNGEPVAVRFSLTSTFKSNPGWLG